MSETAAFHHDYPYRLRLAHPDQAELRLERRGRWVRIDPATPPGDAEITVITGPDRARAAAEGARAGQVPLVAAPPELATWLGKQGPIRDAQPVLDAEGLAVAWLPYTPAPSGRLRRPRPAAPGEPHVVQITFPDGARLVHLDLSLHAATSEDWLDHAIGRFGAPEWLVVGLPAGQTEALVRHVPRFAARRVLLADLLNAERREAGLPTELVTPCRDRLVAAGVEAHVMATQTSFRFE